MRPKVLIADPDPRFLFAAQRSLAATLGSRFEVTAAPDGGAALAAVIGDGPAVAVLSSEIAGRTALDVISSVGRSRQQRGTRFVALLAAGEEAQEPVYADAGAAVCLVKPVTFDVLSSRIAEIAERGGISEDEPFVVLLAPRDVRLALEPRIALGARVPVVAAESGEVAIALAKSPRCRALFASEPIEGFTVQALFEYVRAERVRVPFVRIGGGRCPHPFAIALAPDFEPGEIAALFARLQVAERRAEEAAAPAAASSPVGRDDARREPVSHRIARYVGF
jgi:DNA-binding response OmpR family regulator